MNLFIDECLGAKTTRVAAEFVKLANPPVNMQHFSDLFSPKQRDDELWAERLSDHDKRWVVITADRGVRSKKGAPLQLILPAFGITGYFLSGKLAQSKGFEKLLAVITIITQIREDQRSDIRGTRFKIRRHVNSFRREIWPLKATEKEWIESYRKRLQGDKFSTQLFDQK